jgi:flagellar hook-associated protein 2
MADAMSNMSMSMYGDKVRMWGMGSKVDTQSLVEMEFAMLEMKNTPLNNQKGYFNQEKEYWVDLKSTLTKFQSATENLKNISNAEKSTTVSKEGFVTVTADKNASELEYSLEIQNIATSHKLMSDAQGDPNVALNLQGVSRIKDKDIEITSEMSLKDISAKINEGDYGVNASIISGTLVLTSERTGLANEMTFADVSGSSVFESIGLINSDGSVKNTVQNASDANFTVDGVSVTSSENRITNAVDGVTFNLIKQTTEPLSVSISKNDQLIKDRMKEFVSSYNNTMRRINQHTSEGSVLQGKSIATSSKMDMTQSLMEPTDSSLLLYQVGIELDGITKDGTIKFDESKLNEKLDSDFDEVYKLLVGENGFSKHLFNKMDLITKETGSLNTKIDGLDRSIKGLDDALERNMQLIERQRDTILRKYAAFESMMSSLNIQNDFMTAQIDAMNGSKK